MSRLISEHRELLPRSLGDDWLDHLRPRRRKAASGVHPGLVVAGLVVIGVGLLAIFYVGPDVKRYMKLRTM